MTQRNKTSTIKMQPLHPQIIQEDDDDDIAVDDDDELFTMLGKDEPQPMCPACRSRKRSACCVIICYTIPLLTIVLVVVYAILVMTGIMSYPHINTPSPHPPICDASVINELSDDLMETSLTSRTFGYFMLAQPDWFDWDAALQKSRRFMESGCGQGSTILEIQARYPYLNTTCFNKKAGYIGQAESKNDLLKAIRHWNITLYCDNVTGLPVLPDIISSWGGVQHEGYTPTFEGDLAFDFIYSRDSLNFGKISHTESHLWIPAMLQVLSADGGTAVVHLLYTIDSLSSGPLQRKRRRMKTRVFAVYNLWYQDTPVTITLSHVNDELLVAVLRRCINDDTATTTTPTNCFGDTHLQIHDYDPTFSTDVPQWNYNHLYWANLRSYLTRWQLDNKGQIPNVHDLILNK